jgi:hypothetical protein
MMAPCVPRRAAAVLSARFIITRHTKRERGSQRGPDGHPSNGTERVVAPRGGSACLSCTQRDRIYYRRQCVGGAGAQTRRDSGAVADDRPRGGGVCPCPLFSIARLIRLWQAGQLGRDASVEVAMAVWSEAKSGEMREHEGRDGTDVVQRCAVKRPGRGRWGEPTSW